MIKDLFVPKHTEALLRADEAIRQSERLDADIEASFERIEYGGEQLRSALDELGAAIRERGMR